jgi:hypothetical protein
MQKKPLPVGGARESGAVYFTHARGVDGVTSFSSEIDK